MTIVEKFLYNMDNKKLSIMLYDTFGGQMEDYKIYPKQFQFDKVIIEKKSCFMIMPFSSEFNSIYGIISSLTLDKQYISHKACVYGLYGCFCFCMDMCYISSFCLLMSFVPLIMLRMEALDMNS